MSLTYYRTAEFPDLQLWVLDDDGTLIDFSTGYSFTWKLGRPGSAAEFTKTTNITGSVGSGTEPGGTPNVTLIFVAGELDSIDPGLYTWQLRATSSGRDRIFEDVITIRDVIT